jgi:hypothetical protein
MRRLSRACLAAAAMSLIAAAPAAADPSSVSGHNCAGAVVSGLAGAGFGQAVSDLAHQQTVDNLGLANCNNTNGRNP